MPVSQSGLSTPPPEINCVNLLLRPCMQNFENRHLRGNMTLAQLYERDAEGRFVHPETQEAFDTAFNGGNYNHVREAAIERYIAEQLTPPRQTGFISR